MSSATTDRYSFNANHQIEQIKGYEDEFRSSITDVIKFAYDDYNNLQKSTSIIPKEI